MVKFGVSQPVTRKEDQRFLTGTGRYTDDINLPGQAHAFILRSPHAHAVIRSIETSKAKAAAQVLCVLTGEDVAADGLGDVPCIAAVTNRDGSKSPVPPNPLLKRERVRHVGDAVALVVAETLDAARDAAELVAVDYDPLPVVTDTARAAGPDVPLVWDDAPNNIVYDWSTGDEAATEAAFAAATHVTRLDFVNNRVIINSMEPRGAVGSHDPAGDSYTLYTTTQGGHYVRDVVAGSILDVAPERVRVVTPDVGGGFGMKLFLYLEYALTLWAARRVGRPVKWTCDRSQAFVSDTQGRDHVTHAELALDADGKFLAVRAQTYANMGAYLSNFAPSVPNKRMQVGVYAIPTAYVAYKGVYTNTVPVDAYRGAGRPEAIYLIERLIDVAARELAIDGAELRRRNYIPADAMPYTTCLKVTFDSGEFARNMDDAMALAGWKDFAKRREAARSRGLLRGIGMAYYIDITGGPLIGGEDAVLRFEEDDSLTAMVGTQASGQGHETPFAQILVDRLGVPFDAINVREGDTDDTPSGHGSGGSRTIMDGGGAVLVAADDLIDKAKPIASELLEAAASDIEFADGRFTVAGTDRSADLLSVAAAARKGNGGALIGGGTFTPEASAFPNGCHVCEVEIDPDTGVVALVNFTAVDDFGRVVNPLTLAGQVHGGVVQGVGQALIENTVYDEGSGQLLTGSFMDYGLPRASDIPTIAVDWNEVPCPTNPLGVKGAGEAGAIGAPPAVVNAVVDALAGLGITHVDMPATPERVWRAIRAAGG